MSSDLKVLQVKKLPIYDVFKGEGWENWSRIMINKALKGQATHLGGQILTKKELSLVRAIVNGSKNASTITG